MNAIIMAGCEGTRLKRVTGDLPKPMAPLVGKPLLEHILFWLRRNGVREACIPRRYRPEGIRDYFGDGSRFGMRRCYHVEDAPLGTAGGVKACAAFYGRRDFLVLSGDAACDFDLRALMEAHRRHRPAVTMALYPHAAPLQYGTVLTQRDGQIVSFIEKPDWGRVVSDLVNTGIYAVSPEAMALVPEGRPCDFGKDLFPALLAAGQSLFGLPLDGYWCDIGTPRAYYQCNLDALDGKLRLDVPACDPPAAPQQAEAHGHGAQVECVCHSRARLMWELSQTLMEAGADFSDGVSLHGTDGAIRIAPSPEREAVEISADTDTPEAADALAHDYAALVRRVAELSQPAPE
ncbi:MAG: NTP transferase domain-containing protein [Oscillospiraceae bacterium]|nr:NTP transferase domain-containing protein [Oscillospiraceae bacterium]